MPGLFGPFRVHQRGPGLPTAATVVGRFTGPSPAAPRGAAVLESVRGAGPSFRGSRGAAQVNRLTSGPRRGSRESFSRGGHLPWATARAKEGSHFRSGLIFGGSGGP